ncbi:MAG: D-alanyl-D-alanine carboxypeptidase [Desulfitobacterium sp.]|nr:D-alanyl-D-alanine carboxypeptidase [Desulfitobacterium sp.]
MSKNLKRISKLLLIPILSLGIISLNSEVPILKTALPFYESIVQEVLADETKGESQTQTQIQSQAKTEPPSQSQQESSSDIIIPPTDSSYLMVNLETGDTILTKNADLKRAPASTLKLLTGLLVIDKLSPEQEITVGDEVNISGSSLGLLPGDRIKVKDLLTATFVLSANDAANALAVAAYGTMDNFLENMNQYAKEIGCTDSQFKTASGMPAEGQYITAQDLALIAREFIKNEKLMEYVNMKEATVQWTQSKGWLQIRKLTNTNMLLDIYPGDIGLKTGTTTEAGQCLVTLVTREDGDLLLVLLGSEQRYTDTVELLDKGMSRIRSHSALKNIIISPESLYTYPGYYVQ